MMFTAGYATFGRYRGVPLRWHWSLPLTIVLLGGWDPPSPLRYVLLLALLLLHEAGHHWLVRQYGLKPIGVDLQGLGAETRWLGDASPRTEIAVAWGGVLAQITAGVIVTLTFAIYRAFDGVMEPWMNDVEFVYRDANAVIVLLNLLPLPTFDGEVAWKIVALWRGELRPRRVIVIHVGHEDERPVDPERVRAEVDAELEAITQAHNRKAEAEPPRN